MQAVILAAGKSTRTYPLTLTRPKPLLKAANKALLEHNLDNLNGIVDEAIIVVGYKKDLIKKYIGSRYKNIRIKYVVQKQQLGTAHAVSLAEHYIKNRFILLMGDDIYSKEDIKKCIRHRHSILAAKAKNPKNFGVVIEKNGILADFIEKPKKFVSDIVSTAFYSLDREIFKYIKQIKKSKRNELEMPDAVKLLSKKQKIHVIKSKKWLPIASAFDLLNADKILRKSNNIVGKNSRIYGNVKNSSVGNNCVIKGTVRNSIIMDKSVIERNSIVKNSIIGEKTSIDGKIYNSIISDNAKIINSVIKNCKIWPSRKISDKTVGHDVQ
ncbi:NTP transferase domain-containing protein [Candidatus Woesearchaeota archaeon]|nr:NTP transferase domain-containing protein [Candidatus Woesearchaeota archaeon]